jgi:hypothetical protein
MKTSNLLALILALAISIAGFAAIDILFTQAFIGHDRPSVELTSGT